MNSQSKNTKPDQSAEKPQGVSAPSISLPKGGGAIRGMGEKFAANPVTGTGSMTVPIATSPGRSGFGPQLSLSYDSGAGNGPLGFGWSLSLPAITRKTDKGLPKYQDADESDVFILSGAEDLVPVLCKNAQGQWVPEVVPPRTIDHNAYDVRRYRPRIEGLFARIEHWTNQNVPSDSFWRSISKDNITTWYGRSAESRIADPADQARIFSWLICESHDDKGNVIVYGYKEENSDDLDPSQANERNRTGKSRSANRYLKRIRYGNHAPYLPQLLEAQPWPTPSGANAPDGSADWFFEVVFDYGEHDQNAPKPSDTGSWPRRPDPFSSYRAGFEVRTYRLCQRILMFHHFPDEEVVKADCLVRSTNFTYLYEIDLDNARNPVYSFLLSVTQTGYKRNGVAGYLSKSLPPLDFEYSQPTVQHKVEDVDFASLENLPIGVDGATYQWTDLHGEGIPGILTEQAGAWFYKRNLSPSPNNGRQVEFAPVELVAAKPNLSVAGSHAQFMDLAGDGQPDLVVLDGPMPGLYEHDEAEGWQPFRPFTSHLNRDLRDPNLKFVDLDGDGHADVLITENEAFVWHASLAEEGFGPARRVAQALDEEKGPRLVFADGAQSIYLADLSGDGLADLVRIRNGEVCYWPNLGHCRFGAKVTMDNSPWFDHLDQFDHKRLRLADIDGSGTTDIIYLHADGVRLCFNQSGNSWSQPQTLSVFPQVDDLASIAPTDLLGNGTACLIWSSPLPGDARRPMRYVNLMGGQKPHLLVKTINNLGAETRVDYAPSTKFYLQDKHDGNPWITRLPFPVHVVEKVTVTDKWRGTSFSSTYSYHHGYFDGIEREFRGFGRVEQIDVEDYGTFAAGNTASPYITDDQALYQPPVKTVTWYHTGAFLDRQRILSQFENEYFPRWFEDQRPGEVNVLGVFQENLLPEPDLEMQGLTNDEWREALRACKGMMLRQEIYELDVDALSAGKELPSRLFTTAFHNCDIILVQPKSDNRHAVFHVTESEAITYHYELDLRGPEIEPDPRIAHTLNLKIDEYGNVLESAAAVYPRVKLHDDRSLNSEQLALIHQVQNNERHLALTCTRYTEDINARDTYRLRVPCQTQAWEVTGIVPGKGRFFTRQELQDYDLTASSVQEIDYHAIADGTNPQKRLVECARTLFFDEDLNNALPFGQHGAHGLPRESYKLALTKGLLQGVFSDAAKFSTALAALSETTPDGFPKSGYRKGEQLFPYDPVTPTPLKEQWWIATGIAGFEPDAAQHFYLPERYTDPFGNVTTLKYDDRDLFIKSSTDPMGNRTEVTVFDYRVLSPREMKDINGNLSEVLFDALGMPTAMALKGKGDGKEGDNLEDFTDELLNPDFKTLHDFFVQNEYNQKEARRLLGNATARHLYYFGETHKQDGSIVWADHPACACGILREKHVAQLDKSSNEESPLQTAFEYSGGIGAVLVKKAQAEPAENSKALRWIATGKTILNNKGKPVKQYEPYFSTTEKGHRFEEPREEGVTPVIYYDAVGRLIRTELPDGSFSRVEFSPWHVRTFDPNDTVRDSNWFAERNPPDPDQPLPRDQITDAILATPEQRAAWLAAQHANTPALTILDSLDREVIAIAHNRLPSQGKGYTNTPLIDRPWLDERYLTFTKLDAEGKPLWIRDARGNLVMQYITPVKANNDPENDLPYHIDPATGQRIYSVPCYDIAGNLLFQHSMDAGDNWTLNDAAGKPMCGWHANNPIDENGTEVAEERVFHTVYDALHRPLEQWLTINRGTPQLVEQYLYGESISDVDNARQRNLRGQLWRHYDQSGLKMVVEYDFKGNPKEVQRQLASSYKAPVIGWQGGSPTAGLESETFVHITEYDALNRMTRQFNWHKGPDSRVAVYEPAYNQRGLLESEVLLVRALKKDKEDVEEGYEKAADTQRTTPIRELTYNAKGQREKLVYGNGTITRYHYDPRTFRLKQLRTTRPGYEPDFPGNPAPLKDDKVLQDLNYTYDPAGNITEVRDDAFETAFFKNQKVEPGSQYVYDALYRLIAATGREKVNLGNDAPGQFEPDPFAAQFPVDSQALRNYSQYYSYDCVGNIREMRHLANGGGWTRCYECADDSNRLFRTWEGDKDWNSGNAINKTTYQHDNRGNMLNLANVGPEYFMRWDYRDMIQSLNRGGGGRIYYNYDSGKERTRKVNETQAGVKQWERIYLGGLEIYRQYNAAGDPVEEIETHHLMDDNSRVLLVEDVLQTNNANLSTGMLYRYQYSNHLGSAVLELDQQTAIISYEEYHPYGTSAYRAVSKDIKAAAKRYRYTSKERDEESGLYYHGARYYACWLGRWGSCDPEGLVDGDNLYAHVRGNPLGRIDNNGKQSGPPLVISGDNQPYKPAPGMSGYIKEHMANTATVRLPLADQLSQTLTPKQVERVAGTEGICRNNSLFAYLRKDAADAKTLLDNARTKAAKFYYARGYPDPNAKGPAFNPRTQYLQTLKDNLGVIRQFNGTPEDLAITSEITNADYTKYIKASALNPQALTGSKVAPLLRQPAQPTSATAPGSKPSPVPVIKFNKPAQPVAAPAATAPATPTPAPAGGSAPSPTNTNDESEITFGQSVASAVPGAAEAMMVSQGVGVAATQLGFSELAAASLAGAKGPGPAMIGGMVGAPAGYFFEAQAAQSGFGKGASIAVGTAGAVATGGTVAGYAVIAGAAIAGVTVGAPVLVGALIVGGLAAGFGYLMSRSMNN